MRSRLRTSSRAICRLRRIPVSASRSRSYSKSRNNSTVTSSATRPGELVVRAHVIEIKSSWLPSAALLLARRRAHNLLRRLAKRSSEAYSAETRVGEGGARSQRSELTNVLVPSRRFRRARSAQPLDPLKYPLRVASKLLPYLTTLKNPTPLPLPSPGAISAAGSPRASEGLSY